MVEEAGTGTLPPQSVHIVCHDRSSIAYILKCRSGGTNQKMHGRRYVVAINLRQPSIAWEPYIHPLFIT
jgi:hypothetical protein